MQVDERDAADSAASSETSEWFLIKLLTLSLE